MTDVSDSFGDEGTDDKPDNKVVNYSIRDLFSSLMESPLNTEKRYFPVMQEASYRMGIITYHSNLMSKNFSGAGVLRKDSDMMVGYAKNYMDNKSLKSQNQKISHIIETVRCKLVEAKLPNDYLHEKTKAALSSMDVELAGDTKVIHGMREALDNGIPNMISQLKSKKIWCIQRYSETVHYILKSEVEEALQVIKVARHMLAYFALEGSMLINLCQLCIAQWKDYISAIIATKRRFDRRLLTLKSQIEMAPMTTPVGDFIIPECPKPNSSSLGLLISKFMMQINSTR